LQKYSATSQTGKRFLDNTRRINAASLRQSLQVKGLSRLTIMCTSTANDFSCLLVEQGYSRRVATELGVIESDDRPACNGPISDDVMSTWRISATRQRGDGTRSSLFHSTPPSTSYVDADGEPSAVATSRSNPLGRIASRDSSWLIDDDSVRDTFAHEIVSSCRMNLCTPMLYMPSNFHNFKFLFTKG